VAAANSLYFCKRLFYLDLRLIFCLRISPGIGIDMGFPALSTEFQMMQVPHDLGKRIVEMARLAAAMHLEEARKMKIGRQPTVGIAAAGLVKDDLSSAARARGACPERSPWTLAGDNPAGSFAA
jgi:hypothetical protein